MPLRIADIVTIASFVIGLFNTPRVVQYVEAPRPVQRVVEKDYCKEVSAEQWKRVGQSMFDAFEGTRSENEICKSLVMAQAYQRK